MNVGDLDDKLKPIEHRIDKLKQIGHPVLKNISPARVAAFDALKEIEDGKFSSVVLPEKETQLSPLDRSLCHELVLGVLRWQLQLDKIIEHFAKRKIDSIDPPVRRALRLGIYQLRSLSRVPASAAVNESVNLVARARVSSARAFVNAVLRRATREPDYSPFADVSDSVERIAIETSHPRWLVERWANAFGLEHAEMFARANNETPPVAIRVVGADEETVLDKIRSAGGILSPSEIAEAAWRVSGAPARVRELAAAGEIYIQDEASQLVAQVVDARPRERVLDVCAAPGGKTTLIAHRSQGGSVFAMDVSERRLATVATTVALQRLNNITLVIADAGSSLPFLNESFDRVLVDAPCSGTGTLRHNPEIRWRLTNSDISQLAEQQLRFVMNAAACVKPGGRLVYSTCSVEPEEDERVVEEFLKTDSEFQQTSVSVNERLMLPSGAARTWPQRDGTDGFFIAAFVRR